MAHAHDHSPTNYGRAFAIGTALNIGFVVIEAAYGYLSGSLALIADAGHNASDVLGLLLAWGASALVQRRPTQRHTYGMRRASIMAALGNAMLLLVAVGGIAWEAIRRFGAPEAVTGSTIIWIAAVGVVINAVTAALFLSGRHADVNIRGAFLHMAADAGVSLGVVIGGFIILATGWLWVDPAISLVVAAVILVSTWGLLRDSLNLALDAVPGGIDIAEVAGYLRSLADVREVHDLHIWPMSTTEAALTAHLVVGEPPRDNTLIAEACHGLHDCFGIEHATLQLELHTPVDVCRQAAPNRV